MLRVSIIISALMSMAALAQPKRPEPISRQLVFRIGVENPVVAGGAPIYLAQWIRNTTEHSIDVSTLQAEPIFRLRVTDGSGREVAKTDHYLDAAQNTISPHYFFVPANDVTVQRLNLLDYCKCTAPGAYRVTLTRVAKVSKDGYEEMTDSAEFRIVAAGSVDLGSNPATQFRSVAALFAADRKPAIELPDLSQRIDISLHEPVFATLKFRNVSSAPVRLVVGQYGEDAYRVAVRYPNGKVAQAGPPRERMSVGALFYKKPEAGATEEQTILLNRWVDFEQGGPYTIAVFILEAATPAVFEVYVRPRDPKLLEELAARLTSVTYPWAHKLDDWMLVRTALAYMRDEIALARIEEWPDDWEKAQALAVMDTPESARALMGMAAGAGQGAKDAQRELGGMKTFTRDSAVRQIIDAR